MLKQKKVLVLCTGNSCRSQMAEGIARALYGEQFEIFSAGTKPSYVHPHAITVMHEIGIDISNHRSKSVTEFVSQPIDFVITVCGNADQACPVFPGQSKRIHWEFEDPAHAEGSVEEVLDQFRKVRDTIRDKFLKDWMHTLK